MYYLWPQTIELITLTLAQVVLLLYVAVLVPFRVGFDKGVNVGSAPFWFVPPPWCPPVRFGAPPTPPFSSHFRTAGTRLSLIMVTAHTARVDAVIKYEYY